MPGKDGQDGAPGLDGEKVCKVLPQLQGTFLGLCWDCAELLMLLRKLGSKALPSKKFSNVVSSEGE